MSKRFEQAQRYTEKYRGKLAPCKYCGNTDIRIWSDRTVFDSHYEWTVNCMTPSCDSTSDTSIRKAVQKWNKRHGMEAKE